MFAVSVAAVPIVSYYIYANLLIAAAAGLLAGIRVFNTRLPQQLTYRHLLRLGRVLALAAVLLPILAMWSGRDELSPLKAQVWAASSMNVGLPAVSADARIDFGVSARHASLSVDAAIVAVAVLFASGFFLALQSFVSEARATVGAIRNAVVLRRIGMLRILISDQEQVPFAAWLPGRAYIVLPATVLLRPADMRLALRHEGQHHRQRDTRYVYAVLLGRALFGANPAMHWLGRQLSQLQELACDAALAQRPSHCVATYCACLLRVAEAALRTQHTPLRSFMASWRASTLQRRIEAAIRRPTRPLPTPLVVVASAVALGVLGTLSTVIAAPVQDRRLSRTEAEQLVAATPGASMWGLQVNDAVLKQLNLLLGTPDGRGFLRSSINRMRTYEASVAAELKQYGLPMELRVVPLVESGYQNLPAHRGTGAGLWMFIGPTARDYGLEVSAGRDERLDVAAETRAAMRMFSDLQQRFQSWPLALMAYNSGVARVEAGMNAVHSRDAWRLYQAGFGNEPNYLARTVALMLILEHPELLAR